jgi:hypothetical protein
MIIYISVTSTVMPEDLRLSNHSVGSRASDRKGPRRAEPGGHGVRTMHASP